MSMDVEKLVRDALDEPAPPAPPEPVEDQDGDGGGHLCPMPLLVVMPDGSLTAHRWGTALLVWCLAGSLAAVWMVLSWLWSVLTTQNAVLIAIWGCFIGASWFGIWLLAGLIDRLICEWQRWRGTR